MPLPPLPRMLVRLSPGEFYTHSQSADAQRCHRRRTVEAQEDPQVVGAVRLPVPVLDLALIPPHPPPGYSLPTDCGPRPETCRSFIYSLSHLFSHY